MTPSAARTAATAWAVWGMLFAASVPAAAQDDAAVAAQHSRIAAERGQAQSRFEDQEKACHARFAVNDCINEARGRRRAVLADLRRQEVSLADAQRKRKAAERVRSVEERSSSARQDDAVRRRAAAVEEQRGRQERAASRATTPAAPTSRAVQSHAAEPRSVAPKAPQPSRDRAARTPSGPSPQEAADHVRAREKRLQDAQERRERVARRVAERKAASAPLPVPP